VGHSSLHRLASLSLAQIKIDRAILKHPLALEELSLVLKIANSTLQRGGAGRRPVILEGIDEKILTGMEDGPPLRLGDLYDVGIRYIQGYITGPPRTVDLRPLEPEAEATIRRYWRW
jgi:EAL domain-containing protein (putative c-di-GMP-specific phosphodiesterase class I)